jgi:hypothetical protein
MVTSGSKLVGVRWGRVKGPETRFHRQADGRDRPTTRAATNAINKVRSAREAAAWRNSRTSSPTGAFCGQRAAGSPAFRRMSFARIVRCDISSALDGAPASQGPPGSEDPEDIAHASSARDLEVSPQPGHDRVPWHSTISRALSVAFSKHEFRTSTQSESNPPKMLGDTPAPTAAALRGTRARLTHSVCCLTGRLVFGYAAGRRGSSANAASSAAWS